MDAIIKSLKKSGERRVLSKAERPSQKDAEDAVRTLLKWMGEDVEREGLLDTPQRVAKAYKELFQDMIWIRQ